ncbi:DNA repair protein RecN [Frateuria aurantia]|uniref:DNA repair protein RecN n=1 Tax=Frateuria aurantia (strain ATCC 33424 / DSM 6220 / KCTC 2777 / LMG 1558 / NBRC 3245 / NCIMB 13370) TaxID=767434 RepID=H8L5G9_FRAAD|nr:DNA repair protein RecN [Frateuria aurantia]AFC85770.1 DNA repair protein RecN [Frateuria aurantia DSM 6220]
MLTSLYVRHFAVVEAAEVTLGPGLTVVSGETGAGKSLLVDALLLLSGARADSGMVRAGSDRAELMAEFDLAGLPEARDWLRQQALDEEQQCQLRRVIPASGSSRAWINGRPATVSQLAELTGMLLEIHGQHEHQALLDRKHQLALLDAYADTPILLEQLGTLAERNKAVLRQIEELRGGDDREHRLQLLRHEVEELEQWALSGEALEALEASHRRLANAGRLAEGASGVLELLDGDSGVALARQLSRAHAELERLGQIDARLHPLLELLDNARIQIDEVVDSLGRYAQDVDLDPARLAEIEAHLSHLHELSRRHRCPIEALLPLAESRRDQLTALEGAAETLDALDLELQQLDARYRQTANELSQRRAEAAARLGHSVSELMGGLGMPGGRVEVQLEQIVASGHLDPQGLERCELLVSANPGQPPRALRKVASGGELARISLAIEVATLDHHSQRSMVFDEVDTGIGGAVAEVVGQRLRALGDQRQVLCVTHLPQVAAQGHAHLFVSKQAADEHTRTRITSLDGEGRHDELARMLGGIEITSETRGLARQMLARAQSGKV